MPTRVKSASGKGKQYIAWIILTILSLLPYALITRQLFLRDPLVWPDEAIFVDTAKTLNATGRLATNLFGNLIPGLTIRANWYPPLYFYLLAGWIKTFGTSIESVRALSVILSVAALVMLFVLIYKLFGKLWLSWLGTTVLSLDYMFGQAARIARMDILTFFLLISAYLTFVVALTKKNRAMMTAAGFLCGVAVLTHPFGLLAPAVIGLTILLKPYEKEHKIRDLAAIAVPTIAAILFWLGSMRGTFHFFLEQYNLQFLRKTAIIAYPIQLFQGNALWRTLLLLYAGLFITMTVEWIAHRADDWVRFIAIGSWISTAVILWGKETWFILYFQPFALLAMLYLIQKALKYHHLYPKIIIYILLSIILILNIKIYSVAFAAYGTSAFRYHPFIEVIRHHIPPGSRIFLATLPDPYFDLQNDKTLTFFEFPTVPVQPAAYRKLLDSADLIIINFLADPTLMDYVSKYATIQTHIEQPGGYETIIFKPRNHTPNI